MTWLPMSPTYYCWPTYYWTPTMWQGINMEAAMASEATKMAVTGNMHIDPRVTGVTCIKSEVNFDLQGHQGCLEVTMASEATKMTVLGKQQQMPQ